ncbi:MAG: hypothetical protein HY815_07455 [Candidatus Riflebacteria bacterium]|nr:hypothetical protein [Candidatus Riflebacteria bacterium]
MEMETGKATAVRRCGVCSTGMDQTEAAVSCPACSAAYHKDCWDENRGCAVYGCTAVPPTEPRSALEFTPAYWGRENKPCPACGREILAAALRCRHCGATFESARPQNAAEFSERTSLKSRMSELERNVIGVFVACSLPFTAPLGAVVGGGWFLLNRKDVSGMSSLYRALLKIGLGVGFVQTTGLIALAFIYSHFSGKH